MIPEQPIPEVEKIIKDIEVLQITKNSMIVFHITQFPTKYQMTCLQNMFDIIKKRYGKNICSAILLPGQTIETISEKEMNDAGWVRDSSYKQEEKI